ncbi:hypothetical protein TCAL_10616 [Tigriopus californicus]|uniref:Uncharacterized protein n=1 Tax=Tigriopus californicus TaxID=6832 RepID=A0A553PER6_TIGCA|nr:hypothetical protein TCAL_10616 [Tigriopus californicus]|eukprot:TCALIF_10616-PA protein Name:"Protein of unknown function" AED:0.06 eAED:0.07 QI:0/0/0/0.5/1/1/2/0/252
MIRDCRFCKGNHKRKECPAWNQTCLLCGKLGHVPSSKRCGEKTRFGIDAQRNYSVVVRGASQRDFADQAPQIAVNIEWEKGTHSVSFLAIPDSGSEVSLADMELPRIMGIEESLLDSVFVSGIRGATGDAFTIMGKIRVKLQYGDAEVFDDIIIVREKVGMLISWKKCKELRIFPQKYPSQLGRDQWVRATEREEPPWKPSWLIPSDPKIEEITQTKGKLLNEFDDVLVGDDGQLKAMGGNPLWVLQLHQKR